MFKEQIRSGIQTSGLSRYCAPFRAKNCRVLLTEIVAGPTLFETLHKALDEGV